MRTCWTKTGCLMTADGSEDHLIKPEGLKDYVVLPPSLLEPSICAVASNEPPLDTSEADDDVTEIAAEFDLSDEFIHQDAGDSIMEERNVSDIIDGLLLISE